MDWKTRETKGEWEKQQQVIYDSMVKKWQDDGKVCRRNLEDSEQRWSKWRQISGLMNLGAAQVPAAKDCWEKWSTITKEYQDWMEQKENWKKIISQLRDDAEQVFREIHGPLAPEIEADLNEVVLRYAIMTETKAEALKLTPEIAPVSNLNGPAQGCFFGGRTKPSEVFALWPTLIPRDAVKLTSYVEEV